MLSPKTKNKIKMPTQLFLLKTVPEGPPRAKRQKLVRAQKSRTEDNFHGQMISPSM